MISNAMDWIRNNKAWMFLIAFGFVGISLLTVDLVYELKHPCLRHGPPETCYSSVCTAYDEDGLCMITTSTPYDCSECLERKL